jgi:hypothetical protein
MPGKIKTAGQDLHIHSADPSPSFSVPSRSTKHLLPFPTRDSGPGRSAWKFSGVIFWATAKVILDTRNGKNRPPKPNKVQQFAADMTKDRWGLTGDTIKFGNNGQLLDRTLPTF